MDSRVWKIVGLVGVVALLMGACLVVGGGLVYLLVRHTDILPDLSGRHTSDPGYGLVVAGVVPGGPADEAGVMRGDILLEVDDARLGANTVLIDLLEGLDPGTEVTLKVLHGDDLRELRATLARRAGRAYLGLTVCADAKTERSSEVDPVARGAIVIEVLPGTPAAIAGLQAGDVILAVNGQVIDDQHGLADLIATHRPGDQVTLSISRSGEARQRVAVELSAHPERPDAAYLGVRYAPAAGGETPQRWSLPLQEFELDLDGFELDLPGAEVLNGARVERIASDSRASESGLVVGDVITALDGDLVDGPLSLSDAIASHQPGDTVILTLLDQETGTERELPVILSENPDQAGRAYLGVRVSRFVWVRGQGRLEAPFGPWLQPNP